MTTTARVDGIDLTVTRPWARRPRVLCNGVELPRNRWGDYELVDDAGQARRVEAAFDWRQLGPRLRVGDRVVPLGRPLQLGVRVALVVFVVLGFVGGALGVVLFLAAALTSAALLRRSDRTRRHVVAAAALPVMAIGLYVSAYVTLLARAFA